MSFGWVCSVDNSEYTRNGDFSPSRFQSQLDAVSILSRNKTGSNAESSVGLVDTAGPTCHMSLVTDADLEKLLASLHRIEIKGQMKLVAAVNVAMLALKHRINKRQEQRVIAFVASPVAETVEELKSLGTRMKKNKVAIDIVSFGEDGENQEKLTTLVNAANSGDNSHFVAIATKPYVVLTEELAGSAVFGGVMAMGGGGGMEDDLELAIRLSLQEGGGANAAGGAPVAANAAGAAPAANNAMNVDNDDEMAQAIAMSMGLAPGEALPPANHGQDIDEDLELAIRLSMQDNMDTDEPQAQPPSETTGEGQPEQVDSDFLRGLVQNLEGVDPNDPHIKELLSALNPDQSQENKDNKDGSDKSTKDKKPE
jgi:26S proteasome regulatory subunit N10